DWSMLCGSVSVVSRRGSAHPAFDANYTLIKIVQGGKQHYPLSEQVVPVVLSILLDDNDKTPSH
ncbi:hypothetical protein, partial [Enterobacter ludwigii]|uniref:hypothetical protein n=1 Tax=Enterobacter ludwigii TaxID=299767 RepID=UPI001E5105F6